MTSAAFNVTEAVQGLVFPASPNPASEVSAHLPFFQPPDDLTHSIDAVFDQFTRSGGMNGGHVLGQFTESMLDAAQFNTGAPPAIAREPVVDMEETVALLYSSFPPDLADRNVAISRASLAGSDIKSYRPDGGNLVEFPQALRESRACHLAFRRLDVIYQAMSMRDKRPFDVTESGRIGEFLLRIFREFDHDNPNMVKDRHAFTGNKDYLDSMWTKVMSAPPLQYFLAGHDPRRDKDTPVAWLIYAAPHLRSFIWFVEKGMYDRFIASRENGRQTKRTEIGTITKVARVCLANSTNHQVALHRAALTNRPGRCNSPKELRGYYTMECNYNRTLHTDLPPVRAIDVAPPELRNVNTAKALGTYFQATEHSEDRGRDRRGHAKRIFDEFMQGGTYIHNSGTINYNYYTQGAYNMPPEMFMPPPQYNPFFRSPFGPPCATPATPLGILPGPAASSPHLALALAGVSSKKLETPERLRMEDGTYLTVTHFLNDPPPSASQPLKVEHADAARRREKQARLSRGSPPLSPRVDTSSSEEDADSDTDDTDDSDCDTIAPARFGFRYRR